MRFIKAVGISVFLVVLPTLMLGCNSGSSPAAAAPGVGDPGNCQLVETGYGPIGTSAVHFETVLTGLVVPWSIAILPGSVDWLVSERPGRIRLVRGGVLQESPVITLNVVQSGEGGALGIALHPRFNENSLFYVYNTITKATGNVNRVQQFTLSSDHTTATAGGVIIDDIPAGSVHNGGRIKFGADGMLYISTGDETQAALARNPDVPNGKILRISPDGSIPADNPEPGRPWFIKGIRNTEAFDWFDPYHLIIADNGPTGEYMGWTGGDKVNIVQGGADMGWPTIWHCQSQPGLNTSILSWMEAVPPGGAVLYQGSDIPTWKGSFIIGTLGSKHLHRVVFGENGAPSVAIHEVYFLGDPPNGLGRIRDVIQGPAGELYVSTSNCDGRGSCPPYLDGIFRIQAGAP